MDDGDRVVEIDAADVPIADLVRAALEAYALPPEAEPIDYDSPSREWIVWDHLSRLYGRGKEAIEAVRALSHSDATLERDFAALVAGKVAETHREQADEAFGVVAAMLSEEREHDVLISIANALGWIATPQALDLLLPFAEHESEDLRYQVACALPHFADAGMDSRIVPCLIGLMDDVDSDVRDWATFGLGSQLSVDGPEIREALFRRSHDEHVDTRSEAIMGLARRGDPRTLDRLVAFLSDGYLGINAIDVATMLADPRLLPLLLDLLDVAIDKEWTDWWVFKYIDHAIAVCDWASTFSVFGPTPVR